MFLGQNAKVIFDIMNTHQLEENAQKLTANFKGILAADESTGTIKKRFDTISLESTEENHRVYRQLLFSTPEIEKFISGVILFDETIRQSNDDGIPFPKYLSNRDIVPGIKVDLGTKDLVNFPGEKFTQGLDGLKDRLLEYYDLGARFSKWRAVITIGDNVPSDVCIKTNAQNLAIFAGLSQEAGIVPIVEPEVLMDGKHDIKRCEEVTYSTLKTVFTHLMDYKIYLPGILLKPNMVISGKECSDKASSLEIAESTLRCFKEAVPQEVPGIVFLSGGQSPQEATENLNEINKIGGVWDLSFSYGRALQEPVLSAWGGRSENIVSAQTEFLKRARLNSLAREGKYDSSDEES